MISLINYCAFFSAEKKRDNGEDSEAHSINRDAAFCGVFDGCGGAGAQISKYKGKTEAYLASRVAADTFLDWFDAGDPRSGWDAGALKTKLVDNLTEVKEKFGEKSMLIGGIRKKLPTTAAAAICRRGQKSIEIDLYWAGDSRVYLLTPQGLAQLTEDDLGGIDAMQNLSDDGVLTNMINLTRDFTIHTGHVSLDRPGIVFAATDGCFGYFRTPMEFEYLLLETMLQADCVSSDPAGVDPAWNERMAGRILTGWEETLREKIGQIAGDDYTISGFAIGFDSFQAQKKAFAARANELYARYINGIDDKNHAELLTMWQEYKEPYHRFLCRP